MLAMPPKDRVSSTAVQHSDGVSNAHIRRVDHHAEIPREYYVEITTLEVHRATFALGFRAEGPALAIKNDNPGPKEGYRRHGCSPSRYGARAIGHQNS